MIDPAEAGLTDATDFIPSRYIGTGTLISPSLSRICGIRISHISEISASRFCGINQLRRHDYL
jgi:hypothetical protein